MSDLDRLLSESDNPKSANLDRISTLQALRVMNEEDRGVPDAVAAVLPTIAEVVDRAAEALRTGGKLHYFGAGTSGRIAVLDASECPPTFGVSPELVQGHIAGGAAALASAVEGAEDDREAGAREVAEAGIGAKDVVVAVAASGRTPYCIGALERARDLGALTVSLTVNRETPLHAIAELSIDPVVGAEVLAGSSRLKAGTAQKLVLNMISTGVMIRLGRTYGNLMVGVVPSNEKLRHRATQLVRKITGKEEGAREALETAEWDVRVASLMLAREIEVEEASALLERAEGSLRRALEGRGPSLRSS